MIKFENTEVMGFDHAIRGARNSYNSWDKSDSFWCKDDLEVECPDSCSFLEMCPIYDSENVYIIGKNDLDLMKRLVKAGPSHRKFMRMITVYVDVTAPRYLWPEIDAYKVGTVRNSCSTMHRIAAKEFTLEDFSWEHLNGEDDVCNFVCGDHSDQLTTIDILKCTIEALNFWRRKYLETKDKNGWWNLIQLLPQSYNQKATLMLNYEVLSAMYHQRKGHRLDEWHDFRHWVEGLPYSELITGEFQEEDDQ